MDTDRVLKTIALYCELFERAGIQPVEYPHDRFVSSYEQALSHCAAMLPKMEVFAQEGRIEKARVWLGFVQGVLWLTNMHTLEQLKDHNRPQE